MAVIHNNAEYSSIQEVETDQEVSVILSYTEAILGYMRLCFKKINKFLPDLGAREPVLRSLVPLLNSEVAVPTMPERGDGGSRSRWLAGQPA